MTTIAWDGVTLAADSQASTGDVVCSLKEKKIFQPNTPGQWSVEGEPVMLLGCAGDCGAELELQNLMTAGLSYSSLFLPTFCFSALAIVGKDRVYIISKDKGEDRALISLQLDPYAIGSGGLIAKTAMKCGHDAPAAVKVAIEMDVYSGGVVSQFSIEEVSA